MSVNTKINNQEKKAEVLFTEAPASWNTKYLSPDGFVCQLTLRGETGSALLEKAKGALAHLIETGCTPYYYGNGPKNTSKVKPAPKPNGNGNGKHAQEEKSADNPAWCPIHQCEMKRREKDGHVWYSHKVNGEWCKGK